MREKLLDLMKSEGLKPSQLAEMLGINPAGISHILAGRNKPGFDLLQKILRRFPRINPDWLLLDSDRMYRDDAELLRQTDPPRLGQMAGGGEDLFGSVAAQPQNTGSESRPVKMQAPAESASSSRPDISSIPAKAGQTVARVVIFYTDQTFESYTPATR